MPAERCVGKQNKLTEERTNVDKEGKQPTHKSNHANTSQQVEQS
jgi:hypothetical protein